MDTIFACIGFLFLTAFLLISFVRKWRTQNGRAFFDDKLKKEKQYEKPSMIGDESLYYSSLKKQKNSLPLSEMEHEIHYKKKNLLVNQSEKALYVVLTRVLPYYYNIFAKVRIEDVLEVTDEEYSKRQKYRGYIRSRHIDFLICDKNFFPLFAIELDGNSHYDKKQKEVDEKKNTIFRNGNLPLFRVRVGQNFEGEIRKIKEKYLR